MKKKFALGMVGLLVVGALTGCGKTKSKYLLDVDYSDYVKLCDYEGIEVDKVVFDVSEDEIQEQIDMEMYDYATYDEITDRGIQVGDYVVLDYTGKLDGKESEEYSGTEEEIMVGEEAFYPEAEEALVGLKSGEKTSVELVLTEDYAEEEDVGKNLSLEITVGAVTQENLPECNDEFVKENLDYDSLEEYRKGVKEELMDSKTQEYESAAVSQALEYLVANSTFDGYPEELYTQCEGYFNAENENNAAMFGMEVDEYLDLMGMDEAACKESIEESVNYELVIGAIAQKEGIDCTADEIKKFVEDNYEEFGYDSTDAFFEEYAEEDVGYELIYEKVADFLYEHAKYVEIDEAEYLKQQEADMYDEGDADEEEADVKESGEEGETLEGGLEGLNLDKLENSSSEESTSEEKEETESTVEEDTDSSEAE
ncbi:MAG: FKBP-type peptidyl-prolyl cis-trans isomerase [Clostridiales bacterium]|nr:FKBP-type peptidyl-prolyl cis-trans isomerase [Clostridiales bacterium]